MKLQKYVIGCVLMGHLYIVGLCIATQPILSIVSDDVV